MSEFCELSVRIGPRASSNRIVREGATIKLWVTAPPTDGQANEAAIRMLADRLGVARSRVMLVRGRSSRVKTFRVDGISLDQALEKL